MDCLTFIVEFANAIAWPVFWLVAFIGLLVTFKEDFRAFLQGVYAVETRWLRLYRAVKEAAPEKDIPAPPVSAKQRILDGWEEVHGRLAELYEEKVGKTPPGPYRALASRLKRQGHVRGNTAALLDEVRNMQRTVKRQRESSVSPQLADYYEKIVLVLLDLLGHQDGSTS